jgi:Bacterial PH domain
MASRGGRDGNSSLPLVLRVPPWQAAALFLITAAVAALNLYWHPSFMVRLITIAFGVLALCGAVIALRLYLVVDEQGIGVRRFFSETSVDWSDVADIEAYRERHNKVTLRIMRMDGQAVTVPSALVLPSKPTSTPRVLAQLGDLARHIMALGEPYRSRPS